MNQASIAMSTHVMLIAISRPNWDRSLVVAILLQDLTSHNAIRRKLSF